MIFAGVGFLRVGEVLCWDAVGFVHSILLAFTWHCLQFVCGCCGIFALCVLRMKRRKCQIFVVEEQGCARCRRGSRGRKELEWTRW